MPIGLCVYYAEEGADHEDSALSSNSFGSKRVCVNLVLHALDYFAVSYLCLNVVIYIKEGEKYKQRIYNIFSAGLDLIPAFQA